MNQARALSVPTQATSNVPRSWSVGPLTSPLTRFLQTWAGPFHSSPIIQQSAITGHLIIDSGTNVSVMGRTWAVVDDTGQRCKMSGFANDLVKSDIPVCSGKTVVEVGTQKVLLSLHEAPYLKHNEHGLLSTGQAREYGTWVNDTLRRHGGGQRLAGQDDNGTSYNFNLNVTDGLLTLPTRYPTQEELESLPTVWLTSAEPWDPTSLEVPDEQVLPSTDGTSGDTVGVITLSTKGKKQPPDYEQFRERLGWLPLDTIRKTFDATTQLAGTVPLRLPLRRHSSLASRNSTSADLPKPLPRTRCSVRPLAWAALPVRNSLWASPAILLLFMACGRKAKAPQLFKTSSGSMVFPTYYVTTTRRCRRARRGTTFSVNTASRPN